MFSQAIFGDNTTVVVGHHNTQTVTNTKTGIRDFEALANELRRNNLAEEDIEALRVAIRSDDGTPEIIAKKFGPAIKQWMQTVWGKAIDASWNVEPGIVSGLLTTVIQKYYGWS